MPIQAEFSNRNGGIASAVSATTEQAVATLLATKHFELEDGLTKIFRINKKVTEMSIGEPASAAEPIRLLEVNAHTVASGILPLRFGPMPASGIPFPSIIVEVTPHEFEMIKSKELKLPDGWEIGEEVLKVEHAIGVCNGD